MFLLSQPTEILAQRYVSLNVDNDLYFGIDRYYSSGIFLGFGTQQKRSFDPSSWKNWVSQHWTLGQEINTPTLKLTKDISRMDYPYNGWLFLGYEEDWFRSPDLGLGWGLSFGTTGAKASLAQFFQNTYHIYILKLDPLSWAAAIPQAFHVNAKTLFFWGKSLSSKLKWVGRHQLQAGSFRTAAESRLGLQLGSLPGLPFFGSRLEVLQNGISFFLGTVLEYSVHDYSLSGSVFSSNSPFSLEATSFRNRYQFGFFGQHLPWKFHVLWNYSSAYISNQKYRGHPFLNITISYLF